jgi:hypothetical protein
VPADAAPTIFVIKNEGFIPLEDLHVAMGICQFQYQDSNITMEGACPKSGKGAGSLEFAQWQRDYLGRDQIHTISLQDFMRMQTPMPLKRADISIEVNYRPWILPLRRDFSVRFEARTEQDGRMYWFAK